jgi:hypothetical protein
MDDLRVSIDPVEGTISIMFQTPLDPTDAASERRLAEILRYFRDLLKTEKTLQQHFDSLLRILEKRNLTRDGGSFLATEDVSRSARDIGERIHRRFGTPGMSYICQTIGEVLSPTHMRSLEAAWNGIGDWLA